MLARLRRTSPCALALIRMECVVDAVVVDVAVGDDDGSVVVVAAADDDVAGFRLHSVDFSTGPSSDQIMPSQMAPARSTEARDGPAANRQ